MRKELSMLRFVLLTVSMVSLLTACGGSRTDPAVTSGTGPAASEGAGKTAPETEKAESTLDFPKRTIEVVVPYTAGGGLDAITRFAAEALDVGVPVTITNTVGGSSLVAVKDVANGDKSGHRYVAHHPESVVTYYLVGVFDEDYSEKFQWICSYAYDPMCIAVGKNSPVNTWEELIADAKSRSGEQTWGGSGNLSTNHLAAAIAMEKGEFLANYVPYSGAADARIACIGGTLDVYIGQVSEMVSYAEAGDLKLICTMGGERSSWIPDTPTMAELTGTTENTIFGLHRGVMAPQGVPEEVRQYLEDAYAKVCSDEEWRNHVSDTLHYTPVFSTREECEQISQDAVTFVNAAMKFIDENLN